MQGIKFACSFLWFIFWICHEQGSSICNQFDEKISKYLSLVNVKFAQTSFLELASHGQKMRYVCWQFNSMQEFVGC